MSEIAHMADYRRLDSGLYAPCETTPPAEAEPIRNPPEQPEQAGVADPVPEVDGRTERVRALEIEVAEREEIAALQAQRAETHVESATTQVLRQQSADAEDKRRELANPARIALRDGRAQFWITVSAFLAALIALGWSTANVQATAAMGAPAGSPGWWLAWGVEPLISAALLTVMGAKAYLATRQVTITDRWVDLAQWVPLGYTIALNCWMSLPAPVLTHPATELVRGLLVHSVGPAVVVLLVHALPVLWQAFIRLHSRSAAGFQNPSEQPRPDIDHQRAQQLLDIVRPAYQAGEITGGVSTISRYLRARGHRVGTPMSMWLRDALKQEAA
ncbi:hypothetical protein DFQ14_103100 [Halopolyspora algeriensis]|uniref:Uncharacterized protein n=1 Tax=Halopolyspora algeriensis TaxID=1500506 RepID=A0A368VV21_9ACTN|nr:hypothetical protein [Halopolyspora algeriensis]RCW45136.1 hypothetical protein DFQ14_103100 [Halopolyspora algeriensis]TQM53143.1 hypothetical protein FHU43_2524 [Halopolyspora algeriensis]